MPMEPTFLGWLYRRHAPALRLCARKTFTLISKIQGEPLETTGLRYRVTIKK